MTENPQCRDIKNTKVLIRIIRPTFLKIGKAGNYSITPDENSTEVLSLVV
jgi:hypothetical protein